MKIIKQNTVKILTSSASDHPSLEILNKELANHTANGWEIIGPAQISANKWGVFHSITLKYVKTNPFEKNEEHEL